MRAPDRVVVAVLLATAVSGATGQRVSGRVRGAEGSAISGAVVTALSADGRTVGRTLSGRNGEYSLAAPTTAVKLRTIRIGYRPVTIALSLTASSDTSIDVAMERLPVVLQTVRVAADARCGRSEDGAMVLQLWEQARAALLSAIVARETKRAEVTILRYVKQTELASNLIVQQSVSSMSGKSARPVAAARSPADLAADGYVVRDQSDVTYLAPDADVLFDDTFEDAHCFGFISGRPDRPGQIGLTFAPRRERPNGFVDVDGVLWITRQNPELVQLEFKYTGVLPEAARAGNGGTMRFRTMANGVVFIESWSITIPYVQEVRQSSSINIGKPMLDVRQVSETGGYVVDATWPDGEHWHQPMGAIRGDVREVGTNFPINSASVSVTGTASAETDSAGSFLFQPLPPGRYQVKLVDTALSTLARPRERSTVVQIGLGDTVTQHFTIPSRAATVLASVRRRPGDNRRGLEGFFDRRRRLGDGRYIDGKQLSARAGIPLVSVVRELIPEVLLTTRADSSKECWANIFLDEARIHEGPPALQPNINSFSTAGLAGIEYYPNSASTPPEFRITRNDCGTLILWTRR